MNSTPLISPLEVLRRTLPDTARDIKLNMASLITSPSEVALSDAQRWGCAVAAAMAARCPSLTLAVKVDAAFLVDNAVLDAATTAASIMAMTNIYYRAVHMAGDTDLALRPAGLRMNGLAKPGVDQMDFELFGLAASVVKGCDACIKAHVDGARKHGASTEAIQTSIKIAAVLHAVATILDAVPSRTPPLLRPVHLPGGAVSRPN